MVEVRITSDGSGDGWGDTRRRLRDRRPALLAAAKVAVEGIERNFASQRSGAGPWAPLERDTVKDRARAGLGPTPILYRGGKYAKGQRRPARVLRDTFRQDSPLSIDDDGVTIGSRDERVGGLSDKRPILILQEQDDRKMMRVLGDTLLGSGDA